jgi:serine/threonine-protein kinase
MLAATTPFDTPERDELMLRTAQLDEAPPALGARLSGIPAALDQVMAHALAKDRRHRFASAVELGEAVREALGFAPQRAWVAQREFADLARTISEPVPAADPELIAQVEWLRTAMMTPLGR